MNGMLVDLSGFALTEAGSSLKPSQEAISSALEGHLLELQLHGLAPTRLPVVGASCNILWRRHLPVPILLELCSVLSAAPATSFASLTVFQEDRQRASLANNQGPEGCSLCSEDSRLRHPQDARRYPNALASNAGHRHFVQITDQYAACSQTYIGALLGGAAISLAGRETCHCTCHGQQPGHPSAARPW